MFGPVAVHYFELAATVRDLETGFVPKRPFLLLEPSSGICGETKHDGQLIHSMGVSFRHIDGSGSPICGPNVFLTVRAFDHRHVSGSLRCLSL